MNTKKLTLSGMLIALGVVTSNLIVVPFGVAKCFPVQHFINVISAILLGPFYGVANAIIISLIRNILGVGSILAFPGSIFGAFFASILYIIFKSRYAAFLGELIGTSLIGGYVAYLLANLVLETNYVAHALIIPFFISSFGGVIIAALMLTATNIVTKLKKNENA